MGTVSNIRVEASNVIWNGVDLGFTEGDMEVMPSEKHSDVTAHQEGKNILDAIRIGKDVSIAINLKETSVAQLQTMINAAGAPSVAQAEISTVTPVADVASSLNNKYFFFYTGSNAVKRYIWFNVGAAGTDPAPAGATATVCAIAANASAATIATAMAALTVSGCTLSAANGVVTITNTVAGPATDIADVNTGFAFAVTQQGCGVINGWGSSKDFTSVLGQCAQLTLHPVVKAASDLTRDINFWKAYPEVEGLKLSGEKEQTLKVKFKIFPDTTRPNTIRLWAFGDGR